MPFIIPSNMIVFFVLRYRYAIVEEKRVPSASTIRSHIVSTSPDFCILSPKKESIVNSKISHSVPIAIAKVNVKIAIAQGLPIIFWRLYIKKRIVKPTNPNMIAEKA